MRELLIYSVVYLVLLLITARVIWRVKQSQDPLTAIIPTVAIKKVNNGLTVLRKSGDKKMRENIIEELG